MSAAYKAAAGWSSQSIASRVAVMKSLADALLKQEAIYEMLLAELNTDSSKAKSALQVARNAILKWTYFADKVKITLHQYCVDTYIYLAYAYGNTNKVFPI